MKPDIGYFDDTGTDPAYDPPHDGPCLVCYQPLRPDDVRTISVMWQQGSVRSLFFRVHRTCAENDPAAVTEIEGSILDLEALDG